MTDKSTNIEGHDIVRKNNVVTNTDNDGESVLTSPNDQDVPTSNTSQKGDKLENVFKKKTRFKFN